ncbi:MAG: sigma-54 dependent transcriptional regulator [Planctomycetota bacterium]|nr:sigma-54 dependent transcriptional regulator [Planctomycetota bacterium]
MIRAHILIVDGDAGCHKIYRQAFESFADSELVFETNSQQAETLIKNDSFDLLLAATDAGGINGLDFYKSARQLDAELPAIIIADEEQVAGATASLRLGAKDYLAKPLNPVDLASAAKRVLEGSRLGAEHELLRRQVERPYTFDDIIGASPPMRKVFDVIQQVATSNVDVLVIGDTGTGKELVARAIHRRSQRASGPFVPVDCGAIPDNLLESELFGHERGAFTGADARRIGLLEFADGGTLFLDELGELPLLLQAKLLRTLQERKVRRVGGREEVSVDVRVVGATSRDIDAMIRQGQFRQDLYYRINVVRIDLPPLRQRGDDIGLLAEYFTNRHSKEIGKAIFGITPEAYQVLKAYPWPGNVRELQNIIRRGLALTRGPMIGLDDLPDELIVAAGNREPGETLGYFQIRDEHVKKFERQYLIDLLDRHGGEVQSAAREAKLPRGTLYRLMKNNGLDGGNFRGPATPPKG